MVRDSNAFSFAITGMDKEDKATVFKKRFLFTNEADLSRDSKNLFHLLAFRKLIHKFV